ncbi:MAG: COR domain-containing protein [Pyrinomonadaceae bacterium]
MAKIKVNIETPSGVTFEGRLLSDDYTPKQVISEVLEELSLPRLSDEGEVITYSLLHVNWNVMLPKGKRLAKSGVQQGDTVRIISSHPYGQGTHPDGEVEVILTVPDLNSSERVILPRTTTIKDIIPSLVTDYALPSHDEFHEPITYLLESHAQARFLNNDETLAWAGIPKLDRLTLYRLPPRTPPSPRPGELKVDIMTPYREVLEDSIIPDDYTPERVIPELLDELNLPRLSDKGEVVTYSLLHVNAKLVLPEGRTLVESGVQNGDTVQLVSPGSVLPHSEYIDVLIEAALAQGMFALDLSGLKLTELPESIARLKQLRKLNLAHNNLTELPESIGRLTQLESLDLSDNALKSLPDSLLSLRSLEALFLHGNADLSLPAEILGPAPGADDESPKHPAEILEYYFRARGGSRSLNEAKLILVGRGGVGKTSIVNRLVYDLFKEERKTEGIQITKWNIRLRGDELVRLNVWDFGGQEIMHATHQFFLTQRSLYLLVLNGREGGEDADADYWLKLIESFGGGSPIIVVLNKIKEHPFDVNRRALQQKYPAIRDFIKMDCEDGTGVAQLYKAIEWETDRLEHLRDAFPLSWFAIKERLAGMRNNHLSFDEYREECARFGEKDPASQETLSSYLHSLGIVLNYRDDPRLQDTHVLNPHWVTNGIYKILNSERLEKQGGEILLGDLSEMLDPEDYPAKTHRFLIDLMKKFELCFSFPGDDCHYLIPELLDKQEPPSTLEFDPQGCLNFQYHYPVLPEGLLPRFIVRTQVLSEGDETRWRTGVILSFEGNRALVKGDVQDRKVYVSVLGPTAGRRRLLAIIRSDFERIHRDIRNLNPLEMIPLPDYPEVLVPFQELLVMEQRGLKSFKKVVGDQVIDLGVDELLNGIDLDVSRRRVRTAERRAPPVQLFYSYSRNDEGLRNELEMHLKLMQRQGLLETWHDRRIEAGGDWQGKIDENLERAGVILLLVSADFIASDYCYEREMQRALERQRNGEATVIPVIVRDVNYSVAPFSGLQALPRNGQAVTMWANKDAAWRDVSEGIELVVKRIQRKSAH